MIYDRLKNAKEYFNLKNLKTAFEWLQNTDLKTIKEGRHEILGDEIYANVQTLTTKPITEKKWEVHKKYIDIQYVIEGREKMGYGILDDFKKSVVPYDFDKDVEFLEGEKFNYINVSQGDFVIFYPQDVHAPMLSVDEDIKIKKVIVKIRV